MTRINIVPPSELYDQHLVAEYREITMVPAALNRTLNSKSGYDHKKVPTKFTLNSGHVYFFYNKGKYLSDRYKSLVAEMKLRGMNPNPSRKFPDSVFPKKLFNDWAPNEKDKSVIRERIALRVSQKPEWYRKTRI